MKKNLMRRVIFFVLSVFSFSAWADKPAPNEPFKVYSPDGKYFVQMIPRGEGYGTDVGKGKAFAVGSKQVLWEIDWYEHNLVLSNDGVHLVRIGSWGGDENQFTDFAIGFYKNGRELKTYQVKDLLKNTDAVVKTVSHYFWQGDGMPSVTSFSVKSTGKPKKRKAPTLGSAGLSPDGTRFTLYLIDGSGYAFDVDTGAILEKQEP